MQNDSLDSHGEEQLMQFKTWSNTSKKLSSQREWACSYVSLKHLETHKTCQREQALFG